MKPPGLSQATVNPRPGLEDRVLVADVVAPVAVRLLDPQRVERVVAGVAEAERLARGDDRVVDVGRELGRDVQLPAELADVGHARGPDEGEAEVDLARGPERERLVREVGVRHRGEQLARARAHDADHRLGRGDVGRPSTCASGAISRRSQSRSRIVWVPGRDDQEPVLGQAGDGDVRLDAAALVEPLRVDDPARLDRDVGRADPSELALGVAALDEDLAERGLVEERRRPRGRRGAPRRCTGTSSGGRSCTRTAARRRPGRTSSPAPSRRPRRSTRSRAASRSWSGERRTPRDVSYWRNGQCMSYRRPSVSVVRSWR